MSDETPVPDSELPPVRAQRRHRGDIMSPEKRSAVMSRIRGKNTGPERAMEAALRRTRFRFECHAPDLPGRPDFVLRSRRIAVFVDGDFWHGWDFDHWRDKLSEKWENKIVANRERDRMNDSRLVDEGWLVLRFWEHEVSDDSGACAERVAVAARGRPFRRSANPTAAAQIASCGKVSG